MENQIRPMFDDTELGLIYALVNSSIRLDVDAKGKPVDALEQTFVNKLKQCICEKIADKLNPKTMAYPKPSPCGEHDCSSKKKPFIPNPLAVFLGKIMCDILEEEKKEGGK